MIGFTILLNLIDCWNDEALSNNFITFYYLNTFLSIIKYKILKIFMWIFLIDKINLSF